jgi:hypothetical protein
MPQTLKPTCRACVSRVILLKSSANGWPFRKVSVINGFPMTETYNNDRAEVATFARSIARAEFGRFYWDDRHEREMRLSLAMARERIRQENLRRIKLAKRAKRGG